jgi:predicted amidohydrolase
VVAETGIGRIGLAVCYDLRFPELFRAMVDQGAEVFVVPAAWPAARTEHWRLLLRARAVENQAYVVACNGSGSADGTTLAGRSTIIDPWGELVAEVGLGPAVLRGGVDLGHLEACRAAFPALADRRATSAQGALR